MCLCPNEIGCLYLEPSNVEFDQVLYLLKRALLHWSDPNRAIGTTSISIEQAELYFRHGFRATKQSRCLIRPTERFDVVWPGQFVVRPPAPDDADALVTFLHETFADTVDAHTLEDSQSFINYYFKQNVENSVEHRASTLVIDRESGQVAGACFIYLWEGWPLVGDIAVHKDLRSQGLASNMLRHALSTAHEAHPVLREFSTAGNVSGSLYHHLGFVPGSWFYEMVLPHPQATDKDLAIPKW